MNSELNVRQVKMLGYGLSVSFLLIHIMLFFLFRIFGVTPMTWFNLFSVGFYGASLLILKFERLHFYSVAVHLEVVAHMTAATCLVGTEAGFQITLLGMVALAFCEEYMSARLKIRRVSGLALSGIAVAAYLGCYLYSRFFPVPYQIPQNVCYWLQIAWGVVVFTVTIFFLKLFVINTLRSERTVNVVKTLAAAIDAKDPYTKGHSGRVADYSREIAKRAGMGENAQNRIFMMALLHDVGKIGVPDAVINKPGRLSDEEFAVIKEHTVTGARILETIDDMPELALGAHWHHERIDGTGYPSGLKGFEIPEEARIIAVADAYDAMTSDRSYRGAMPRERVRQELMEGLGTQFDPKFGLIMLQMMDEDPEYRMRER